MSQKTHFLAETKRREEKKIQKTNIEWVKNPDGTQGYTWNPITGCLNHTPEGLCRGGMFPCYAYKAAHGRLKQRYLGNINTAIIETKVDDEWTIGDCGNAKDPFYPRFWGTRMFFDMGNNPKGIFVCDMSDLFGIGIPEEWTQKVLRQLSYRPNHRFYLLTKQPQNLPQFSPFPDNCWVGVTATNDTLYDSAMYYLDQIKASVRYISFEPLLTPIDCRKSWDKRMSRIIDCVIIGAQTKPYMPPRIEWVEEIVEAADQAGIPIFLKNNLEGLWTLGNRQEPYFKFSRSSPGATEIGRLRQEMPR